MTEPKIVKHIVTNVSDGPKVLNALTPGVLQPGDSTDEAVEMTEGEFKAAEKTGWFKFGSTAAKAGAKD